LVHEAPEEPLQSGAELSRRTDAALPPASLPAEARRRGRFERPFGVPEGHSHVRRVSRAGTASFSCEITARSPGAPAGAARGEEARSKVHLGEAAGAAAAAFHAAHFDVGFDVQD